MYQTRTNRILIYLFFFSFSLFNIQNTYTTHNIILNGGVMMKKKKREKEYDYYYIYIYE